METEVLIIKTALKELVVALADGTSDTPNGMEMYWKLLEVLERLEGR